jgi:hypothetical protein
MLSLIQFIGVLELIICGLATGRFISLVFCGFHRGQESCNCCHTWLCDGRDYGPANFDYFDTTLGSKSLAKTGSVHSCINSDNLYDEPRAWLITLKGGNTRHYIDSSYKIGNWYVQSISSFASSRGSSMSKFLSSITALSGALEIITAYIIWTNSSILLGISGLGLILLGQFDSLIPIPQSLINATRDIEGSRIIETPEIVGYKQFYSTIHSISATVFSVCGIACEIWMWRCTASVTLSFIALGLFGGFIIIQILLGTYNNIISLLAYMTLFPSQPDPSTPGHYTNPESKYYPAEGSFRYRCWEAAKYPKTITTISIISMFIELFSFGCIILSTSVANVQNVTL